MDGDDYEGAKEKIDRLESELERERHEFAAREHALCLEVERMRDLAAEWLLFCEDVMPSDAAGCEWLDGLRSRTAEAAKRKEGKS